MSAAERRWPWWIGLALVLAGSAALRVWGIRQGLPYAYNVDENAHFVPGAIALFDHGYDPHYFINPPAYTYLLHAVFDVWFGGRAGVSRAYAHDPTEVWVAARLTTGAIGTLAVGLLYLAGAKLLGRTAALIGAAVLAVAFLPVFYSHLALNDVPTLAPVALALWGVAGVLRDGRRRWYALAGVGLGLACATKYTGGLVVVPLLIAGATRLATERGARLRALTGLVISGLLAAAVFVAANPYSVLDWAAFTDGLTHQADASADALGKLGQTEGSGYRYYLWTLTWGLGWAPVLTALGGAALLAREQPRVALALVPAPIIYVVFMGSQERFFGRWLMPAFPIICLLAGYLVARAAARLGRGRRPALRAAVLAVGTAVLLAQGVLASVHSGDVLANADTRNLTRAWMVDNIPPATKIVVEPVVPDAWATDIGAPYVGTGNGARWRKYATSRSNIANDGSLLPDPGRSVNVEDYERTLFPGLVDRYIEKGYCWVISGSTQRGRAENAPLEVPRAIEYYRELEARSTLAYEASPYHHGARPVKLNFDWAFDFYPRAYERPGPLMRVYRLHGGVCGP